MLRAIVFDFDGVIANSEPLHYRAFQDVLAEEGVELTERDYYARYLGFTDRALFQTIAAERRQDWNHDVVSRMLVRKASRFEQLEREMSMLFPGAEAFIRAAAESVVLAIASGALRAEITRVLDQAGLSGCFRAIVAAEDVQASKPAPDPYVRAVSLLGEGANPALSAAECVAIEDSRWGIDSARAAGLRTVALTHSYDADELSGSDLVVPGFSALDLAVLQALWS
jgi:beta-phosphoglucomutase